MDALLRSKGTKSTLNLEIMNEVIVKQFLFAESGKKEDVLYPSYFGCCCRCLGSYHLVVSKKYQMRWI